MCVRVLAFQIQIQYFVVRVLMCGTRKCHFLKNNPYAIIKYRIDIPLLVVLNNTKGYLFYATHIYFRQLGTEFGTSFPRYYRGRGHFCNRGVCWAIPSQNVSINLKIAVQLFGIQCCLVFILFSDKKITTSFPVTSIKLHTLIFISYFYSDYFANHLTF